VEAHREPIEELFFTAVGSPTSKVTHLRLGTSEPSTLPLKTSNGTAAVNLGNIATLHNRFSQVRENGSVS
jgi:hypothetical protein